MAQGMGILPLFVGYVPGLFGYFGIVPHEESNEGVLEGFFDGVLWAYAHVGGALAWALDQVVGETYVHVGGLGGLHNLDLEGYGASVDVERPFAHYLLDLGDVFVLLA